MTGAELIAMERSRQLEVLDWTTAHDDEHTHGDLVTAARCYALYAWWQTQGDRCGWNAEQVERIVLHDWPWDEGAWRPTTNSVRNLVKAGALIAAEIDRLLRRDEVAIRGRHSG